MCQEAWWTKPGDELRERKEDRLEDRPPGQHNPNLSPVRKALLRSEWKRVDKLSPTQ